MTSSMQRIQSDLTFEMARNLYESDERFPISLDDAWKWIGWTSKQQGKNILLNNFEEGDDFLRMTFKKGRRGRPGELFMLTIECFKFLAMKAGTVRGKEVRRYFLQCEEIAKAALKAQSTPQKRLSTEAKPYYRDRLDGSVCFEFRSEASDAAASSPAEYKTDLWGETVFKAHGVIDDGEEFRDISMNGSLPEHRDPIFKGLMECDW